MDSSGINSFYSKVVGVTHRNKDGTERQRIIGQCACGESLLLVRDPGNRYSRYAIRIMRQSGEQLGYISDDTAAELADEIDRGAEAWAEIAELTGGTWDKPTKGVNIIIHHTIVPKPPTPSQIAKAAKKADKAIGQEYLELIEASLLDGVTDEEEERTARIFGSGLPAPIVRAVHAKIMRKLLAGAVRDGQISDAEAKWITSVRNFLSRLGWAP